MRKLDVNNSYGICKRECGTILGNDDAMQFLLSFVRDVSLCEDDGVLSAWRIHPACVSVVRGRPKYREKRISIF